MRVRLSRVVRFTVCDGPPGGGGDAPGVNGYGGKPAMRGLGRYYELAVVCSGKPEEPTGYLVNIKTIDQAVHASAVPRIVRACRDEPWREPGTLMRELLGLVEGALAERLGGRGEGVRVERLAWRLTPTYSVEMERTDMGSVLIRQRFDFAAAHRLHVPGLSDEQNRATFGRCNNPAGHGHNYGVQPTVRVRLGEDAGVGSAFDLAALERITDETIIQPFDHTHLNEDTTEFATGMGLNPSVEHIAQVFFERLRPAIAAGSDGRAELVDITVWETDRTSCTYAGE